jgi:hypothetical protein
MTSPSADVHAGVRKRDLYQHAGGIDRLASHRGISDYGSPLCAGTTPNRWAEVDADIFPMRSKLFVPGSRPELFAKALAGPADAISIDLEDAVEESRKGEARAATASFLGACAPAADGKVIIIRINGLTTPHFDADLEAVVGPHVDLVNLPMVEAAEDVRAAAAAMARVESRRGLAISPLAWLSWSFFYFCATFGLRSSQASRFHWRCWVPLPRCTFSTSASTTFP